MNLGNEPMLFIAILSLWYCIVLHVERQQTKQKLSAGAGRLNSGNTILHCIMCIVALIAGGEGRTMSEYNKLRASLSFVYIPVLQPITLMQMVRASFDALISLPAVPVPWWLPAVHREARSVCSLSFGEVMISFTVSFLRAYTLVKYIYFTYTWILGFAGVVFGNLMLSEKDIS